MSDISYCELCAHRGAKDICATCSRSKMFSDHYKPDSSLSYLATLIEKEDSQAAKWVRDLYGRD